MLILVIHSFTLSFCILMSVYYVAGPVSGLRIGYKSQNFASEGTILSAEGLPFKMMVHAKLKISSNHGS